MNPTPDNSTTLQRRQVLQRLAALGLILTPLAATACGGGMPMMGDGGMMDADMQTIMELLNHHELIARSVEDIDGGIRSRTTSTDPRIAALIATHVAAMKARIEQNHPIRQGDPLFAEIFKHHNDIHITITPIDGGVEVAETSPDPQVVFVIRQHARAAVSQFVAEGMHRAMRPTPLPDGYRS